MLQKLKKPAHHTGEKSAILPNPSWSSPLKTAELWEQNLYSVLFVLVWIFRQKGKIKDRISATPWVGGSIHFVRDLFHTVVVHGKGSEN